MLCTTMHCIQHAVERSMVETVASSASGANSVAWGEQILKEEESTVKEISIEAKS